MIRIEFYNNGVKISGHANANKYGDDIYCAGVSAITQGAINWFNPQEIKYKINSGLLELKIINLTEKNLHLLLLLEIQLKALMSDEHQKYIHIEEYKNKGF